jgi:lipopolysaccharide export system permease protein
LKIYSYIIKAHIAPFFLSFFIVIFIFTFQFLIKFLDNLVGKGLSYWVIVQLITLNLAWMVTLAVPMAVLISTLMAFGSLSSTNEITILRGIGMSTFKLVSPVIIFSAILCYGLILFNNRVLPEANHRTKVLMNDIQRTKPTFVIEEGKFSEDLNGLNIFASKTFAESNRLEGLLIIDNSKQGVANLLTAEWGEINFAKDNSKIIVDLYNGEIHQLNKSNYYQDYRHIKFNKHVVNMAASGFGFSESDKNSLSRGDRELSSDSMRNIVDKINTEFETNLSNNIKSIQKLTLDFSDINYNFDFSENNKDTIKTKDKKNRLLSLINSQKQFRNQLMNLKTVRAQNHKQIDVYLVEIYKKYSIPFACIVFALIGAPLGIKVRKGGFGVAAGISFAFFLLYWASLMGGEKLADREFLNPFWGMWSANFLLGIFGLYFVFREKISLKKFSQAPGNN